MRVITCPSCGDSLATPDGASGRRARCRRCSHTFRVPELPVAMREPVPVAVHRTARARRFFFVTAASLVVLGLLWAARADRHERTKPESGEASESSGSETEPLTDVEIYEVTKELIKPHLVAPRDAEFTTEPKISIVSEDGDPCWHVSGWVDAQNKLGVYLRATFKAEVHFIADTRMLRLEVLWLNGEVAYLGPKSEAAAKELLEMIDKAKEGSSKGRQRETDT